MSGSAAQGRRAGGDGPGWSSRSAWGRACPASCVPSAYWEPKEPPWSRGRWHVPHPGALGSLTPALPSAPGVQARGSFGVWVAGAWCIPGTFAAAPAPTLHRDKQQKPSHSPGCSPEINRGSYLWRHVCNGPMNFMEMRCCGGVRYWVLLLLLLKLRPLKSHPSAASPVRALGRVGDAQAERGGGRAGQRGLRHRRAGSGTATLPRHEGLSTVRFYSPHTPLLKCKKRKNLNRVLFALKTLSMICELSQPW